MRTRALIVLRTVYTFTLGMRQASIQHMLVSLAGKRLKMVIFSLKVISSVYHRHLIVLQIKDTKRKITWLHLILLTSSVS
jgi:hypothetical protein